MSTLTCPKCHGQMHSYERNGITVDQCAECRGIFLDRGELEHLVAADSRAHAPPPSAAAPPRTESYDPRRGSGSHDPHYGSGHSSHHSKRKKHWVEELFG